MWMEDRQVCAGPPLSLTRERPCVSLLLHSSVYFVWYPPFMYIVTPIFAVIHVQSNIKLKNCDVLISDKSNVWVPVPSAWTLPSFTNVMELPIAVTRGAKLSAISLVLPAAAFVELNTASIVSAFSFSPSQSTASVLSVKFKFPVFRLHAPCNPAHRRGAATAAGPDGLGCFLVWNCVRR